jgi:hypothetical protein
MNHSRARSITRFLIAACAGFITGSGAFAQCFDNESMQNMAQRSGNDTGTLIYVWSPRMVLSVTQAHLAQQAAQQLGLDFLPLLDSRISARERDQALQAAQRDHAASTKILQGSQTLCASDLTNADALRHFPTAFVLTARGTHRLPIVGAMPQPAWQIIITERLKP